MIDKSNICTKTKFQTATGWSKKVAENPPRGDNWTVILVERGDGGGWRLHGSSEGEEVFRIFDAEGEEEKVERCAAYLHNSSDLQIRGGFVFLKDVEDHLGISRAVVEQALLRIREDDPAVQLEQVDGREIIKRRRV